jgi:hypothetical protein
VRLEDDDGISGFVVSPQFKGMPSLERQELIDDALVTGAHRLAPDGRRRIFMIAGLTPIEYETVGSRVRIRNVRESAGGSVEVVLDGGPPDAEYIRGLLDSQKGVKTSDPEHAHGAAGVLMSVRAKGTSKNPLTKEKVIRILKGSNYVQLVPNALASG